MKSLVLVAALVFANCFVVHAIQAASTSFDCSKATAKEEKMVCSSDGLAAMDLRLADLYKSVERNPDAAAEEKQLQRKWIAERNACGGAAKAHDCIQSSYQRRIIALEIQLERLSDPVTAEWKCGNNSKSFTTAFYNKSDPQSAVLTYDNDQVVALVATSGSGSRYTAPGIEYWEHQHEAMVNWRGKKLTCTEAR